MKQRFSIFFAEKLIAILAGYLQQGSTEAVQIDADDTDCIKNISEQVPQEGNDGIDDLPGVDAEEIIEDEDGGVIIDFDPSMRDIDEGDFSRNLAEEIRRVRQDR